MASCNDPQCVTSLDYVLDAFRSERAYQLRRWGFRQPDGSMCEAPHSVADFILYMQDYYHEARHKATREAGIAASADALRKIVCLAIACLEQHYKKDGSEPYIFDDIAETMRRTGRMVPLTRKPTYSNYLLKIAGSLKDAAYFATDFNDSGAVVCMFEIIGFSVECFMQYGIEPRDLTKPIINERDRQPA